MTKPLPPEPPLLARFGWWAWSWLSWPWQVRQMKQARFRRVGWMTWEAGAMDDNLGRIAYTAYAKSCGYKSIRGDDLPVWQDQDPAIQEHWNAAAQAVAADVAAAIAGDGG